MIGEATATLDSLATTAAYTTSNENDCSRHFLVSRMTKNCAILYIPWRKNTVQGQLHTETAPDSKWLKIRSSRKTSQF